MNWIILGLFSAVMLGVYDIFRKASLEKNAVLPVLWISTLFSALPFLVLVLAGRIPVPTGPIAFLLGAKAVIVAISWVLEFFALKHLPLSIAAPIRATQPFFTLMGAVTLFSERLNIGRWAGILLTIISCAYFAIGSTGRIQVRRPGRHVVFAIAATLVGAASSLFDKYLLATRRLDPFLVQSWYTFGIVVLLALVFAMFWIPQRARSTPFVWRWSIPCIGLTLAASDALYFTALSRPDALIAILAAIRRSNVIIPFAYAMLFIRETNTRPRAIALCGILAGALMMILS